MEVESNVEGGFATSSSGSSLSCSMGRVGEGPGNEVVCVCCNLTVISSCTTEEN